LFFQIADPVSQFELSATALTDSPKSVCVIVEASKPNVRTQIDQVRFIAN